MRNILFLMAVLLSLSASAQGYSGPLTSAQLTTLCNNIKGSSDLANDLNSINTVSITNAYNADASPTYRVWKTKVLSSELVNNIVWSDFTGNAGGVSQAQLMTSGGSIDATIQNIRDGWVNIFGSNSTTNSNFKALSQRSASRFEVLFSTGTGSNASPGVVSPASLFGYKVTIVDITEAVFTIFGQIKSGC